MFELPRHTEPSSIVILGSNNSILGDLSDHTVIAGHNIELTNPINRLLVDIQWRLVAGGSQELQSLLDELGHLPPQVPWLAVPDPFLGIIDGQGATILGVGRTESEAILDGQIRLLEQITASLRRHKHRAVFGP